MNKLYNDTAVQAIANAIRSKNGSSDTYTIAEMSTAINDISYYAKPTIENVPLATFEADGLPLNSLKVSVESKQAGSGVPSPENVRPISGWSEVVVSDVGKNLIPNTGYTQGLLGWNEDNAEAIYTSGNYITSPYIKVNPNTKYAIHAYVGAIVRLYITDKNHNKLYWIGNHPIAGETELLEIPSDGYYVRFSIGINGQIVNPSNYGTLVYAQLEVGETATTYEPYNGITTTISLPQTVYGGEVDVVNGILKITDGYIASYNGETLPSTWISSMDVYAEGTSPTTGAEVCYELAEPIIINLTPTLIKSLEGTNNLSVDCGDVIELEYFKEV